MIYIYSMTGAVLHHYDRKQLTEETGWNDLQTTFFQFAGKTFLISLIVFIPVFIIIGIFAGIIFSVSAGLQTESLILLFLFACFLFGIIIVFAPFFSMLYFPAYFSEKRIWESIKISYALGFKNWGSLFVAVLLAGVLSMIVSMIFTLPYQIVSLFTFGQVNILTYILATLSAIGSVLAYPVLFLIFAFQYFSIVEKEEGVSLQSQIDEFENL